MASVTMENEATEVQLSSPPEMEENSDIFHVSRSICPSPRSTPSAPLLDQSIPANYRQAIKHLRADRWKIAMEQEIKKLNDNHT